MVVPNCGAAARFIAVSGRVTPRRDPGELPSLRERNPGAWWVAVILAAAMVLSTAAGLVAAVVG